MDRQSRQPNRSWLKSCPHCPTIRSDLFDVDGFQPTLRGGYRLTAALLIMLWLAVPVGLIVRRLLKRPDEIAAPVAVPRASLVEQIRPLIRAAAGARCRLATKLAWNCC